MLAELEKSGLQIDANYLLPLFNWFLLGLFSFFFFCGSLLSFSRAHKPN